MLLKESQSAYIRDYLEPHLEKLVNLLSENCLTNLIQDITTIKFEEQYIKQKLKTELKDEATISFAYECCKNIFMFFKLESQQNELIQLGGELPEVISWRIAISMYLNTATDHLYTRKEDFLASRKSEQALSSLENEAKCLSIIGDSSPNREILPENTAIVEKEKKYKRKLRELYHQYPKDKQKDSGIDEIASSANANFARSQLNELAKNNKSLELALSKPNFSYDDPEHLLLLANEYKEVAEILVKHFLKFKISLNDLRHIVLYKHYHFFQYRDSALYFLLELINKKSQVELNTDEKCRIVEMPSFADYIFTHDKSSDELDLDDLLLARALIFLSYKNQGLRKIYLGRPEIQKVITGEQISRMIHFDEETCAYVFDTPRLVEKLSADNLFELASYLCPQIPEGYVRCSVATYWKVIEVLCENSHLLSKSRFSLFLCYIEDEKVMMKVLQKHSLDEFDSWGLQRFAKKSKNAKEYIHNHLLSRMDSEYLYSLDRSSVTEEQWQHREQLLIDYAKIRLGKVAISNLCQIAVRSEYYAKALFITKRFMELPDIVANLKAIFKAQPAAEQYAFNNIDFSTIIPMNQNNNPFFSFFFHPLRDIVRMQKEYFIKQQMKEDENQLWF